MLTYVKKWPTLKTEWHPSWWAVKGVNARNQLREYDIKWDDIRYVLYLHATEEEYLEIFVTDEESETMLKLMSE